jgi:hypothetical protein
VAQPNPTTETDANKKLASSLRESNDNGLPMSRTKQAWGRKPRRLPSTQRGGVEYPMA